MKSLIIASLVVMSFQAQANENSSMAVGIVTGGTTYALGGVTLAVVGGTVMLPLYTTLTLSGEEFKIVVKAMEDAAVFVATEGEVRTVALEQALEVIRTKLPANMPSSDLQIAQSILAL
jgi:conserverd hypothetical protein